MKSKTQDEYLADLDSPDLNTKFKALEGLGKSEDVSSRAVYRVISLLMDKNWKIRARAARSLGEMGQQAELSIRYLVQALDDKKVPVRVDAILALGRMGLKARPAIPGLVNALSDPSFTIRAAACHALGSIGPAAAPEAANDLMKIVVHTDDFTEKLCAWEAVQAVLAGDLSAETLSRFVEDENIPKTNPFEGEPKSRIQPKKAPTQKTIKRYLDELNDPEPQKRAAALRKLSQAVCLRDKTATAQITPGIPAFILLLDDSSWKVRSWAARLLGRIGPPAEAAAPGLSAALRDPFSTVRACAAYALGLLGGEPARAAIPSLELALHDPNQHVRNCAHMALTRLDHARRLSEKINDDDELDWYRVVDSEIGVQYAVVGYKEHIPEVKYDSPGDEGVGE